MDSMQLGHNKHDSALQPNHNPSLYAAMAMMGKEMSGEREEGEREREKGDRQGREGEGEMVGRQRNGEKERDGKRAY